MIDCYFSGCYVLNFSFSEKSLGEHCLDSGQCTVPPLICNTTEKSCKCDPTTYYQNGQVCEESKCQFTYLLIIYIVSVCEEKNFEKEN